MRKPVGVAIVAALIVLPLVGAGVFMAIRGGYVGGEPSRFAGEGRFALVLGVEEAGLTDAVGEALQQRCRALGVEAENTVLGPGRLRLSLLGVRSADELIDAILPVQRLTIRLVVDDASPLVPPDGLTPGLTLQHGRDGTPGILASSQEALEPILRAERAADMLVAVEEVVPWGDGAPPATSYVAVLLEGPVVITNEDVVDASVDAAPHTGATTISVRFSEAAARRFESFTSEAVGRRLAIVLDHRVLSAPIVQSAIPGGRAAITLARESEESLREAHALVAAFGAGALPTAVTLESIESLH